MAEIIKAKNAGFCFGVNRAVNMAYDLLENNNKICTLGPLIHNKQCVMQLEQKGALTVNSVSEIPKGYAVVIRSHGVPLSVYENLNENGIKFFDATCPFVVKIHNIAIKADKAGATLFIAGDKNHPEVQSIVGHTKGEVFVFANFNELQTYLNENTVENDVFVVAQTTFETTKWLQCCNIIKKVCTNAKIFDTICNATWTRQNEAEELSRKCDRMVIIGGKHSSNTQKLVAVAAKNTKVCSVETKEDLDFKFFLGAKTIGVTAGASTPSSIIEEVLSSMSEILREEEMSFEEMLDASMKQVFSGQIVKGVVTGVSPSEVQVDIGMKHTGFIKLEELTNDASAKADELVKKGDELDLMVISVKDQDGIVYLSKRKLDENKGRVAVQEAVASGEILDGYVSDVNTGGLVVLVNNVRVFVPRSQATLRHSEDYTKLVKQNVRLKIIQCEGRHVVGSIRQVLASEADALKEKFWADVAVDKKYTGTVKSLANYGAFIDIGGIDGLVHISELSWERIKHPSAVLNVGDTVEVYVKDLDTENKKVSLGYKKADDNPWEKLKNEYPVGSEFTAPVVSLTKFGAFVRILPSIDGLVHVSEISHERVEKVSDVLKVGQEVNVKLTEVDFEKKRISLSMKALLEPVVSEQSEGEEQTANVQETDEQEQVANETAAQETTEQNEE